jgi:glycerol-3-phosphate dehydrogenase
MLNYALHATTQNRDRDPADAPGSVDFAAFDAGPTEAAERPGAGDTGVATDGGRDGD